ncbi:hypothetical protein IV203_025356 [Nitzschia inconspicua]|uniref:Uncharacterized protein n=1 Tax=Nitzschia inconspicua TaxID=303405 RepID=A0A9K3PC07_9STRA|nr:hypothetical protein IV203_024834 [Nitzschia inconspicua]KAG7362472.1 hypothetical protein IV203_025356 [Nitzschia inconspicua]
MSNKQPKQDESQHQRQASVTVFQAIIDNPSFSERLKRDLLRSVMQKQLEKGDHSFINPNSPFTKSFLEGVALIDKYAATPDKPSMQRGHCYDFIVKKIDTLLPAHMERPLVPQGEASGARKLDFPESTPSVIPKEDTNDIPEDDTNRSIALQVEKGNEPTPAHRTTVAGNNGYFCQDLKEWDAPKKNDSRKHQAKRKASKELTETQRVSLAIKQMKQRKKARNNNN